MELFTATGKLKTFFTTTDVRCGHHGWPAHSDMIVKFGPHTRHTSLKSQVIAAVNNIHIDACVART
jgi:hypothetical protein